MLCDGGCGIQARLVNKNRAILLEGNPKNPVNAGGICPLGAAALQFYYAPYRVAQPMKQTRKRGDAGGFQFISWDEAIAVLSGKLAQLKAEGKARTVAAITGQRPSSMGDMWQQFFTAYSSPNFFRMPAQTDSIEVISALTLGQRAPFAFALENASYVLSFGANLLEGWGAPGRMQTVYRLWRQEGGAKTGVKVVQVDSRCSMTASKADQWVAVTPGAEAALALGIAHVLVKEKLYDSEFVQGYVFGFEDWADAQGKNRMGFKNLIQLPQYAPEEVAKLTGVDASRIRELAKDFAGAANAVVVWGDSSGNLPGNIYHDLAYLALNVLKGNLKSGGTVSLVPSVPLEPLPDLQLGATAKRGMEEQRLDRQQSQKAPMPGNDLYAFLDAVSKGAPYPINVLMVHEANPVYSLPENKLFQAALEKVGFLVSFSSYMDETAQQADLILPNQMALERYDDAMGAPGVPYAYYAVASPILKPGPGTKHTGDVLLTLAKTLGGNVAAALPWKDYQSYLQKRVEGLASSKKGAVAEKPDMELWKLQPGDLVAGNYKDGADLWKKLTSGLCWYDSPVGAMQEVETATGKFELALGSLEGKGLTSASELVYLPHFARLSPSGDEKEFPLLLVSYPSMSLSNGYLPNPPFMTKALWDFVLKEKDLFVELNPQTAQSLGMAEGSRALLKTPQGELPVRVHLYPGARPGVVYMVEGLGHTAYDQYIQNKGVNANSIMEVQLDPVTGLGTVWATRAQLRRA
jgi:anaerobic selenocysteine-containing dehydrogenase